MPLYHLVYFSTRTNATEEDIPAIEAISAHNNARDKLTGCLFFDDRHFYQVVEGRRPHLSALLARLMQDRRHSAVTITEFAGIDHRSFEHWEMKPIRLDQAGIRETYAKYSDGDLDPETLSGSEIWDMLESMARTIEAGAQGVSKG